MNTPTLDDAQKAELIQGYKNGPSHCYRMRCRSVLLKAEGRKSKEVGLLTEMCHISVNSWLSRYKKEGIEGLKTRPGRGRKPILKKDEDDADVLRLVKENRQRAEVAKAEWEAESGRSVSHPSFRRFLKSLAEGTGG